VQLCGVQRKRIATAPLQTPNQTTGAATERQQNQTNHQTKLNRQPIAAAVGVDAIAHSIPGLNVLLGLLSEPAGAAAGVAYMMTLVLSSPAVDPQTLAPKVCAWRGLVEGVGRGGAGVGGCGQRGGSYVVG